MRKLSQTEEGYGRQEDGESELYDMIYVLLNQRHSVSSLKQVVTFDVHLLSFRNNFFREMPHPILLSSFLLSLSLCFSLSISITCMNFRRLATFRCHMTLFLSMDT